MEVSNVLNMDSQTLNLDVVIRICEYLEVDDVLQCSRVCSKWHDYVSADRLWHSLWSRDMAYFATSQKSFGSQSFSSYKKAYCYFYEFLDIPIYELSKLIRFDSKSVENNVSENEDQELNNKAHEVELALRGETDRLRKRLLDSESNVSSDINTLRFYSQWYYYGNFSYGVDGFIYKKSETPLTLIDYLDTDEDLTAGISFDSQGCS
jgi:hypothetical protein